MSLSELGLILASAVAGGTMTGLVAWSVRTGAAFGAGFATALIIWVVLGA